MLKTTNREFFHGQPIFTKYFSCLRHTPPSITRYFRSDLWQCTWVLWTWAWYLWTLQIYLVFVYVFFDVPKFSFKEQFPLKSTHLHLKIYGEQINFKTEILIKGKIVIRNSKTSINKTNSSIIISSLKKNVSKKTC